MSASVGYRTCFFTFYFYMIIKVWGFQRVIYHPKSQLEFYFLTVCQYWVGIKCLQIPIPKSCYSILEIYIYVVEFSTD